MYQVYGTFIFVPGLNLGTSGLKPNTEEHIKRTLYSEKNMNSLNVEYFLAMNFQNLDKNW